MSYFKFKPFSAFALACLIGAFLSFILPSKHAWAIVCFHECTFTIEKDGHTYTGTTAAWYNREKTCSWPWWGCENLISEVRTKVSLTNLAETWFPGVCGNTHTFTATVLATPTPTSTAPPLTPFTPGPPPTPITPVVGVPVPDIILAN